jgi:two-component sensor histidine kinase/CheY-like chemotaxis protein
MSEFYRHQISVLFVEDNESIRNLYIKWLEKRVMQVYYASNGQEGMELFTRYQPDLLISDISMPIINGLEMIKKIKQANPGLYVIIMSAYSFKEYFLEAISLGVNGYLIKPVEPEKLFAMVDELAGYILMHKALEEKERKRQIAESNLKKSLEEKEILLKEVHHRVKNNMQIISSILKMQERLIDDPKLKSVLGESQNRIRSMALIHENLYRNENLANIQFKNYVQALVNTISRSYSNQQRVVSFSFDMEDVFLPIDIGIPCGLIINELISNAFKHAFPDRATGNIRISLAHEGNGAYCLSVADDGIGINNSFSPEKANSLGMRIVYKLVEQIEAKLTYDFAEGTKYFIRFNL